MMRPRRHNCVTPSNSVRRHLLQYRSSLRALRSMSELARIGQLVPDDFYSRSSVGETGVDHFVDAREQRGRHGEPTS